MAVSSLIFDLDGTISDPSVGITRCFNHALKCHGFAQVSTEVIQHEIGPPLDQTFRKLTGVTSEAGIGTLISSYRERYSDVGYAENTVYSQIPDALRQFRDRGVKMGVCTSKRADFAERILALFDLGDLFEFVDGGDIGISKQAQLHGLLQSKLIDKDALMIGDRSIDVLSARGNGLQAIGVLWGFGDYQELEAAAPVRILRSPEELAGIDC